MSRRDDLLEVLEKGPVDRSLDLVGVVGYFDSNEVHNALYSLQKMGKITFKERHEGGDLVLTRIRLRTQQKKEHTHVETVQQDIPTVVQPEPQPENDAQPEKPAVKSHAILEWMKTQKPDDKGWIMATTGEIAGTVDVEPGFISAILNNLEKKGDIEILRMEEGKRNRIIGVRTADAAKAEKSDRIEQWKKALWRELPATPHLDSYTEARTYAEMYPTRLSFISDPAMEEALSLKVHLTHILNDK